MIRLLRAIAEELEERAAILQALEPQRREFCAGMREAAKSVRQVEADQRKDPADVEA